MKVFQIGSYYVQATAIVYIKAPYKPKIDWKIVTVDGSVFYVNEGEEPFEDLMRYFRITRS